MPNAIAVIHEEKGVFGVSFPDFPDCISTAATLDDALARGAQALALHIEGMIADGEALPELRGIERMRIDEADWLAGGIIAAVPVEFPGKAARINISIDETLLKMVDRAAESAGQSRSGFIANAVRQRIAMRG